MSRKKSRKSRRQRRQTRPTRRTEPRASQPSTAAPPAPTAVKEQVKEAKAPAQKKETATGSQLVDFVHEYAYVYYDLRKMFTLAFVMLLLLILVNFILTHYLVVG